MSPSEKLVPSLKGLQVVFDFRPVRLHNAAAAAASGSRVLIRPEGLILGPTTSELCRLLPPTSSQRYWAAVATQFLTVTALHHQPTSSFVKPLLQDTQLLACGAMRAAISQNDLRKIADRGGIGCKRS